MELRADGTAGLVESSRKCSLVNTVESSWFWQN
jgi:hypothetical protein